jgi:hypothetical protein
MKQFTRLMAAAFACAIPAQPHTAAAQPAPAIPPSISTPDRVESRLGPLEFKDGAPSKATLEKVYDNLDFTHAFNTFVNTFQGVNLGAWYKGYQNAGVKDNELIIWSELMDAKSLFQRGHDLLDGLHRPDQGAHGARDTAPGARHHRRYVVGLKVAR